MFKLLWAHQHMNTAAADRNEHNFSMKLQNNYHLTYCTNIHPGETWQEIELNLKNYIPSIKKALSPEKPFGIGLRLANLASETLLKNEHLQVFKAWLAENDAYVSIFNGFPYGGFHRQVVKDEVHQPDWTTQERLHYTLRLFNILAELLPQGMDGGISTSPLSYKLWYGDDQQKMNRVLEQATAHLARIAEHLYKIRQKTGQLLHLDIEPEPDGMLDHTQEVVDYYKQWLIPQGIRYLKQQLNLSDEEAETCLKDHIQICYDVCHFAVVYEKPQEVFSRLKAEGIKIGRVQISAALKSDLPTDVEQRERVAKLFNPFVESTYLHQVVQRNADGSYIHYNDLPAALEQIKSPEAREWRTHFHVPVFLDSYGDLNSTQEDILQVLAYLKQEKVTNHLEVETYTWEVLPEDIRLDLADSITRELQWVKKNME